MKTKQPFGVRAVYHPSGVVRPIQQFGLVDSAPPKTLVANLPVVINATTGVIEPISQGATFGTEQIFGIFNGLQYIDATGFVHEQPIILAGTILNGANSALENESGALNSVSAAYLFQDESISFEVQVNGALDRSAVGQTFSIDMSTINDLDISIGMSKCMLYPTPVPAAAGQFTLTQLADLPGNSWNDPFPIVRVKLNKLL